MRAEGKSTRLGLSATLLAAPADVPAALLTLRTVRTRNTSIHLQPCLQRVLRALTTSLYSFKVACLAYLAAAASSRATKREA